MALTRRHFVGAALPLSALTASGCLLEGRLLQPYETFVPLDLDDGWPITHAENAGFDPDALEALYQDLHDSELWQLKSLLVFRGGQLVAESYFKTNADLTQQRAIWSCTKQVVGVLTGLALEQGLLTSVEETLGSCLEEVIQDYPDKADITLANLLQMRSGIAYSNDGADGQTSAMLRKLPKDSAQFILSLPMSEAPGAVSAYNDGNPHLISLCIQRRAEMPLAIWAAERLFERIGFKNYSWNEYPDGSTLGGFGILTTPRELAKVAQLVLDDGQFGGQQLVSADWIRAMTAPQVDTYNDGFGFGYFWWFDHARKVPFMNGHGGQYAFIDRASATIVVMTAEPNTQGDFQIHPEQGLEIFDSVLPTLTLE